MINYNISKPKEAIKKIFTYKHLYVIMLVLLTVYFIAETVVRDLSLYNQLVPMRMNRLPEFLKMLMTEKLYTVLNLIGRIGIPVAAFMSYISTKKEGAGFAMNMLIVTALVEMFYDRIMVGSLLYWKAQSPFLAIFMGILLVLMWDKVARSDYNPVSLILPVLSCAVLAFFTSNNLIERLLSAKLYVLGALLLLTALFFLSKRMTFYRLILVLCYLYMSVASRSEYGISIALFMIVLTYFEPVRKNQAIFGAVSLALGLSMVLGGLFVFEYDEDYNRRESYYTINYCFMIVLILLFTVFKIIF